MMNLKKLATEAYKINLLREKQKQLGEDQASWNRGYIIGYSDGENGRPSQLWTSIKHNEQRLHEIGDPRVDALQRTQSNNTRILKSLKIIKAMMASKKLDQGLSILNDLIDEFEARTG